MTPFDGNQKGSFPVVRRQGEQPYTESPTSERRESTLALVAVLTIGIVTFVLVVLALIAH